MSSLGSGLYMYEHSSILFKTFNLYNVVSYIIRLPVFKCYLYSSKNSG
jgi:hypothetical protein